MNDKEVDTVARTLWGEARGEGDTGMQAVGCVIFNRVQIARKFIVVQSKPHPLFGDGTFADCCQRKFQFSCWNAGDPNLAKLEAVDNSDPQFVIALRIAEQAVAGTLLPDITNGATHYYERHIPAPPWAVGKTPCAEIGNHRFFKNV